jgi:mono/diheme cytochrome c family protein
MADRNGDPREQGGAFTVKVRRWAAAGLAVLMLAGCSPMDDLIVSIFGRSMREQPSFNPYENPQPPPEGSVPFASGNFPASAATVSLGQSEGTAVPAPVQPADLLRALTDPEAVPQVTGLENPVPVDAESLARGQVVFERACAPCHGVGGDGDGPVTEAAAALSRSLHTDEARNLGEGYIYSIIRVGRGAMPALGHQITHFDRWHVVNYVRQLQGQAAPQGDANGAETGSPEN